jgi:hypothetical protein
MNVSVVTCDGEEANYDDVDITFDTTLLEVTRDGVTTRYPLVNVICFTTEGEVSAPSLLPQNNKRRIIS